MLHNRVMLIKKTKTSGWCSFVMQDHFFFSSRVLLLFKKWQVESSGVLAGACIAVFVFTFLYEIAAFYQSRHANVASNSNTNAEKQKANINEEKEKANINEEPCHSYGTFDSGFPDTQITEISTTSTRAVHVRIKRVLTSRYYIWTSLSLPFLTAANYFIMLSVMTYNAWLLIAVCLASGLAYFLLQVDRDVPQQPQLSVHRDVMEGL